MPTQPIVYRYAIPPFYGCNSRIVEGLLGGSAIFDVIWMASNEQNGFIRFLTILLLILKVHNYFHPLA
jgi:hypothetical protein